MDPRDRVIEAARAALDAYRLAEEIEDPYVEALRVAMERLASALAALPGPRSNTPQEQDR
jgi:hypothetical protein